MDQGSIQGLPSFPNGYGTCRWYAEITFRINDMTSFATISYYVLGFVYLDPHLIDAFNTSFVNAWKSTHNYRVWRSTVQQLEIIPG